jgi:nitrous oxide reductase accessory protein NosL
VALTLDPQLAYYVVSDAAGSAGATAATRFSEFSLASASALGLGYGLSLCTYTGMEVGAYTRPLFGST